MLSEYQCLQKLGSFSIDDPEAGRKLVENLDRRRVRIQFIEACWHFGFTSPDGLDRMRVRAILNDLCARGELVQAVAGLYCRPDMTVGRASVEDAVKKLEGLRNLKSRLEAKRAATADPPPAAPARAPRPSKPKHAPKPRGVKDTAKRDREAMKLLTFAVANGPNIRALSFAAEGQRIGMDRGRVTYILTHLRAKGMLTSNGYGTYRVTDRATALADDSALLPDDAA